MNEITIRVDPKSSEEMYELDKNFREFKRLEGVTSIRKSTRERITLERKEQGLEPSEALRSTFKC